MAFFGTYIQKLFYFDKTVYWVDSVWGILIFVFYGISIIALAILVKFIKIPSAVIYAVFFPLTIFMMFYIANAEYTDYKEYDIHLQFFCMIYGTIAINVFVSAFLL